MNRNECKKYIKRAYSRLLFQNKTMNPENLAIEMEREIKEESKLYTAYAKLAMHNLNKSASEITANQLVAQIDIIPKIYSQADVIVRTQKL